MDALAYLLFPIFFVFMDVIYFVSIMNVVSGFINIKREYKYKDFLNYRVFGIILSSFIGAFSWVTMNSDATLVAIVIFVIFHFWIYANMYFREAKLDRS
jgi:hypothetical protein